MPLGIVKALRKMIVHSPACIRHGIGKLTLAVHVILRDHVFADIAAAFALTGHKADPFQLPVFHAVVAVIFHVIPHAVADLEQLVTAAVGIVNAIPFATHLNPPEVGVLVVRFVGQIGIRGVFIRPCGRCKFDGMVGFADLEQAAHAHGIAVRLVGRNALAKVGFRLASVGIFRAAQGGENGITRAIGKPRGVHLVEGLGTGLPRLDRHNAIPVHGRVQAGGAQQQRQILLCHGFFIEDAIPDREFQPRILIVVLQHQLLDNAALTVILAVRTAHPHADLARRVTAQHGAILQEHHARAVSCRRYGAAKTRKSAANDAKVCLIGNMLHNSLLLAIPYLLFYNKKIL